MNRIASRWRWAALTAVALLGWKLVSGDERDAGIWVSVERSDLVVTIDVEGTLQAVRSRQLGAPPTLGMRNFKIAYMAPEGQEVEEGERILAFDTSELEWRLDNMKAAFESAKTEIEKKRTSIVIRRQDDGLRLEEARGKLEKAMLKLERPDELVAAKETRELELDRELAAKEVSYLESRARYLDEADDVELNILEEQRDRASERVAELEAAIARMSLSAPSDGTVVYVADRRGEKKRVGDSVSQRHRILAIPDLDAMMARGMVDEAAAGRLAPGQSVVIRLDAYPDVTFEGTVTELGKTVQPQTRNSPLRVVRVDIALAETDRARMRPEMRFRGKIQVERIANVVTAPLAAIHQDRSGATPYVLTRSLTGPRRVAVRLGARNADSVEVRSGLSASDQVFIQTSASTSAPPGS